MEITKTAARAAMELSATLEKIDEAQVQVLVDAVMSAQRIYFAGAGRSLLALRCVAMRFMHVNFEVYIVGDTTTPAFTDKDLSHALIKLTRALLHRDSSFVTLYYGADVSDEQAEEVLEALKAKLPDDIEVTLINGGQPVYYYMISVE